MGSFFRVVAAATFVIGAFPPLAVASPELRTTIGVVAQGAQDEGRTWFDLVRIDQRFVFDPRKVSASEDMFKMLQDSSATNKSISVHFFVDGATFDIGEAKPSFLIHDLTYDGRTIQVMNAIPAADPNDVPLDRDVAAANLAKGIALAGDADMTEAFKAISLAVDSSALEMPLKALALKTRGNLSEDHAIASFSPGLERDKYFLAALTDGQAWQALAPDDPDAATLVARNQAYLGAYDEAIAGYRSIIERWPDELFWAEIRIAVIYRRLGEYDKALATFDELVKRDGPQTGMGYHYHRGWVLKDAGRYPEAVAEFTAGIENQPDFQGAFMMRACALAQTGDIKGAIADQEQVIKLFDSFNHDTPPPPELVEDRRHAADVLKELQTAYTKSPNGKLGAPCTGYSDWAESKRERSPLLPPPAAH